MSEKSLVIEKLELQKAYKDAMNLANIFIEQCGVLEEALYKITECACCEQFTCSSYAAKILEESFISLEKDLASVVSETFNSSDTIARICMERNILQLANLKLRQMIMER
jgi:hypothetical protein